MPLVPTHLRIHPPEPASLIGSLVSAMWHQPRYSLRLIRAGPRATGILPHCPTAPEHPTKAAKARARAEAAAAAAASDKGEQQQGKGSKDQAPAAMEGPQDLPYTIPLPASYNEFAGLVSGRPASDLHAAITRIRVFNAVALATENKRKMQVGFVNLRSWGAAQGEASLSPV